MSYPTSEFCYSDNSSSESFIHSQKYHLSRHSSSHSPNSQPSTPFSEHHFENSPHFHHLQDGEVTTSVSNNSNSPPGPASGTGRRRQRKKSPTVVLRLKKFRRMKANDRERHRMHLLNDALERLRLALPALQQDQRLTKIETLRYAHDYITVLTQAVVLIKQLRGTAGAPSPPPITSPIGLSCGGELELIEGQYVVRVGNVRIVLDKEGNFLETNASRPATPPVDSELDGYEGNNCSFVGGGVSSPGGEAGFHFQQHHHGFPFDGNANSINFQDQHQPHLVPMSPTSINYHNSTTVHGGMDGVTAAAVVGTVGRRSCVDRDPNQRPPDLLVRVGHVPDVVHGHQPYPFSPHSTKEGDYSNYPHFQHLKHNHNHQNINKSFMVGISPTRQNGGIISSTNSPDEDSASSVSYNSFTTEHSEASVDNSYPYY